MCCPLVFEFSVGIGGFVIGLGQITFFFSSMTISNVPWRIPVREAYLKAASPSEESIHTRCKPGLQHFLFNFIYFIASVSLDVVDYNVHVFISCVLGMIRK